MRRQIDKEKQLRNKEWREKNKEHISKYNKKYNEKITPELRKTYRDKFLKEQPNYYSEYMRLEKKRRPLIIKVRASTNNRFEKNKECDEKDGRDSFIL